MRKERKKTSSLAIINILSQRGERGKREGGIRSKLHFAPLEKNPFFSFRQRNMAVDLKGGVVVVVVVGSGWW